MKTTFSFLSFLATSLLLSHLCVAQSRELDSLQNLMKTANDTTQVNLLRYLGIHSRSLDKEMSVEYGVKSLNKAIEISFVKGQIESLYALGLTHGMTGSYAEALEYLKTCLNLSMKLNNHQYIKKTYNSLGIVYKRIGDYTNSKDYYLKSIQLVDSLNLPFDNSSAYINLGILYDLLNEEDKAIENYGKSLEVYKGNNKEGIENTVLANLAVINYNNKDYEAALSKLLKVMAYHEKGGDKFQLCTSYSNLGDCYFELADWELALEYLNKALDLANELSDRHMIPKIYYNLGRLMLKQEKYDEALAYSKSNIEFLEYSGEYKDKLDAHQQAAEVYDSIKQYPKSIHHINQAILYKDSLLNETKIRELQNLQIQHEVYLKDKEINEGNLQVALLNAKVSEDRRRLIYLSLIAGLLLFSATLLYFRFRAKKKSSKIFQEQNQRITEQNH